MLLTVYGTEWSILCWCAVKKLLTQSERERERERCLSERVQDQLQWIGGQNVPEWRIGCAEDCESL